MLATDKKWNIKMAGLTILLLLLCAPLTAYAEIVELDVGKGITGTARYSEGSNDAPAVLILHGFLQTRDFYTVMRLGAALEDADYTVLVPTLSLGLDRRKKSLACEAIHSHSLDGDVKEIGLWVEWLHKKTGKPPVVIGHSMGGLLMAAYLDQASKSAVSSSILISLAYFGRSNSNESIEDAERARQALEAGEDGLHNFGLSYCKKYLTTAQNFLSYYEWSRGETSSALRKLTVPVTVIVGSSDNRIDKTWVSEMQKFGVDIISITGANHFFDGEYEFELTDMIEALLSEEK